MALYEYRCEGCDNVVETFRSLAERDDPAACALCGGELRRQVSNPAIQFNGAGFTRTPAVMRDPIALGHPGRRENWGTTIASDLGGATLEDD
jgi:putative FmdB family regulatory protein